MNFAFVKGLKKNLTTTSNQKELREFLVEWVAGLEKI